MIEPIIELAILASIIAWVKFLRAPKKCPRCASVEALVGSVGSITPTASSYGAGAGSADAFTSEACDRTGHFIPFDAETCRCGAARRSP